jgi:hypothetical protein
MKKGDLLAVQVLGVNGRVIRGELLNYDFQTCKLVIDEDPPPSPEKLRKLRAEFIRIMTKKTAPRLRPARRKPSAER